jgi:ABC-2 type transport system permease protein
MTDSPSLPPPGLAESPAGSIYDLGYQRYEGVRLGRRHAIWALYRSSLRAAFGFGRRTAAKIAPFALVVVALGPALLQLVIAALPLPGDEIELFKHEDYYALISFVLAIYVAAIAPDIVGRDQNNHTLTLYFTRAISRADYVLAKFLALVSAMLLITLVPQLVLFVANGLVASSFADYLHDEADLLSPIVSTALLGSALIASIGAAIAAQTPQRAFATVGIVATFLLTTFIAGALVSSIDSVYARLAIYLSPVALVEGLTSWMFVVEPNEDSLVSTANFELYTYALAAMVVTVACYLLLLRRYKAVQA